MYKKKTKRGKGIMHLAIDAEILNLFKIACTLEKKTMTEVAEELLDTWSKIKTKNWKKNNWEKEEENLND
mgnify:CR=1 FL=1